MVLIRLRNGLSYVILCVLGNEFYSPVLDYPRTNDYQHEL